MQLEFVGRFFMLCILAQKRNLREKKLQKLNFAQNKQFFHPVYVENSLALKWFFGL